MYRYMDRWIYVYMYRYMDGWIYVYMHIYMTARGWHVGCWMLGHGNYVGAVPEQTRGELCWRRLPRGELSWRRLHHDGQRGSRVSLHALVLIDPRSQKDPLPTYIVHAHTHTHTQATAKGRRQPAARARASRSASGEAAERGLSRHTGTATASHAETLVAADAAQHESRREGVPRPRTCGERNREREKEKKTKLKTKTKRVTETERRRESHHRNRRCILHPAPCNVLEGSRHAATCWETLHRVSSLSSPVVSVSVSVSSLLLDAIHRQMLMGQAPRSVHLAAGTALSRTSSLSAAGLLDSDTAIRELPRRDDGGFIGLPTASQTI
ncbi:hypothetical protein PMIN03_001681 [Paraphaeosphaeria minitans]